MRCKVVPIWLFADWFLRGKKNKSKRNENGKNNQKRQMNSM
jgi:hypothetical protein